MRQFSVQSITDEVLDTATMSKSEFYHSRDMPLNRDIQEAYDRRKLSNVFSGG